MDHFSKLFPYLYFSHFFQKVWYLKQRSYWAACSVLMTWRWISNSSLYKLVSTISIITSESQSSDQRFLLFRLTEVFYLLGHLALIYISWLCVYVQCSCRLCSPHRNYFRPSDHNDLTLKVDFRFKLCTLYNTEPANTLYF